MFIHSLVDNVILFTVPLEFQEEFFLWRRVNLPLNDDGRYYMEGKPTDVEFTQ